MSVFDAPRFLWEVRTPLAETQPKKPAIPDLPDVEIGRNHCGVYFLIGGDLVKIGCSRGASSRLAAIRAMSPVQLRLVAWVPCCTSLESTFHEQLARWRSHGEWFRVCPEIAALIQFLNTNQSFRELCGDTHERRGANKRQAAIRSQIRQVIGR